MKVYGYCRISTSKQSMERQIRNIKLAYPDAVIVKETYTGTKIQGRKEFEKLLKIVSTGDTLVFDSVSRMSRTAQEELLSGIFGALNRYMLNLAKRQIQLAFEQAEKEVTDLHQRTREGIQTAKLNGKQIGLPCGTKLITEKSVKSKEMIQKYSRDFSGGLNDAECIKLIGISRGSYYKYKRELKNMYMSDTSKSIRE